MMFCTRGILYPAGYRGRRRLFRVWRERPGKTLRQTPAQLVITTAAEARLSGWPLQGLSGVPLRKSDVGGYEVCQYGNMPAQPLEEEAGCRVLPLNPGDLRILRRWRKKTDREDALKIAKSLRNGAKIVLPNSSDTPEEEPCRVPPLRGYRATIRLCAVLAGSKKFTGPQKSFSVFL
jgi:hypothetical protein